MILSQHVLGDLKAWKAHVLGLKEIIRLRGGFETVYREEFLRILLTRCVLSLLWHILMQRSNQL
jgi:hypothetical protein